MDHSYYYDHYRINACWNTHRHDLDYFCMLLRVHADTNPWGALVVDRLRRQTCYVHACPSWTSNLFALYTYVIQCCVDCSLTHTRLCAQVCSKLCVPAIWSVRPRKSQVWLEVAIFLVIVIAPTVFTLVFHEYEPETKMIEKSSIYSTGSLIRILVFLTFGALYMARY